MWGVNLDGALLLNGQASKDKWQLWADFVYMKLRVDAEVGRFPARLESRQTVVDTAVAYQFASTPGMQWYGYLGARYVDVSNEVAFNNINPGFGDQWVDPLIGLKNQWFFHPAFYFNSRVEVGGFGVGSDFSWLLAATLTQSLSERWAIKYSFRYLDIDYDDSGFIYDMAASGIGLGITYRF